LPLEGLAAHSGIRAGTAFPENLAEFARDGVSTTEHTEWLMWTDLLKRNRVPRLPLFGDYAIAHPDPVHHSNVNPGVPLAQSQLIQDKGVRVSGMLEGKFVMESVADVDVAHHPGPLSPGDFVIDLVIFHLARKGARPVPIGERRASSSPQSAYDGHCHLIGSQLIHLYHGIVDPCC
jgi:hypothetical protein